MLFSLLMHLTIYANLYQKLVITNKLLITNKYKAKRSVYISITLFLQ